MSWGARRRAGAELAGARRRVGAPLATVGIAAAVLITGCGGASPAVLEVRVDDHDATAFPVADGRAVTVAHVLQAGRPVFVAGHRARVVRVDRRLDIALLAVAGMRESARRGDVKAGEHATVRVVRADGAVSVPATVRRTITAHIGGQTRPALELSAAVMPGDSGAPVVDGDGRVVGIVFAQASGAQPLAYALDARALGAILR